jgi:hypothetical protein
MFSIKTPKLIIKLTLTTIVLTCYDMLWDLFLSLLHTLYVIAHYLFELCESSLDALIEHLFHTSPRITEIIVFYIMAGIISLLSFLLLRAIPSWYCIICEQLNNYYQCKKTEALTFWHQQTILLKIKLFSLIVAGSFAMLVFALS